MLNSETVKYDPLYDHDRIYANMAYLRRLDEGTPPLNFLNATCLEDYTLNLIEHASPMIGTLLRISDAANLDSRAIKLRWTAFVFYRERHITFAS